MELQASGKILRLATLTPTAVTDNSTGETDEGYGEVKLMKDKFTHVNANNDLADKTSFDGAVTKANNAIAVLADLVNEFAEELSIGAITGGDGVVAVAGTVPAMDKVVTGVDGDVDEAVSRAGGNAALKGLRDNFSTVLKSYNRLADAFGLSRVADVGHGTADDGFVLDNKVDTGVAVSSEDDAMSKAHADAQFTRLANNVAFFGTKVTAMQTWLSDNAYAFPEPAP